MAGLSIFKSLGNDIDGMMARDPAARSRLEIVLCYPAFHVLLFYRLASFAWRADFRLLGRWLSQVGRWLTGIEIHPGAQIGPRLFIDHGMGVVIGETAEIGADVTLYHDVTLGGVAPSIDSANQVDVKRHPTLRDGVIVGAGAQILGPITVGECARVGANAVVTADVAPRTTVVGIPARSLDARRSPSVREGEGEQFIAYGTPVGDIPDPVLRAMNRLAEQVERLQARVVELERHHDDPQDHVSSDDVPKASAGPQGRGSVAGQESGGNA